MNDLPAAAAAAETYVNPDKATSPSVMVVNHPLVQHKVTLVRSEDTTTDNFRRLVRRSASC
jgi:uracil phosphoribosyltransferase